MAVLAVLAGALAAGLFASGEFELMRSLHKPAVAPPSDDEVYTGSILYVPG